MESSSILYPDQKLLNKSPELAADKAIESLKVYLGPNYNLWSVLGELCKQIELQKITFDTFIHDGRYVMILRQDQFEDKKQATFVKELLVTVFGDLSRLKVEVAISRRRVSLGVDLDSITKS
jgi:hypothetical protein